MKRRNGIYLLFVLLISTSLRSQVYTLQKALAAALANNRNLSIQKDYLKLAEADLITAGLRPNPVLNNQSLQLVEPGYFLPNTTWGSGPNMQIWWQLTKPMLLPGVRRSRMDVATINIRVHEQLYLRAEEDLLLEICQQWIHFSMANKRRRYLETARAAADSMNLLIPVSDELGQFRGELYLRQLVSESNRALQVSETGLHELRYLVGTNEMQPDTGSAFIQQISSPVNSSGAIAGHEKSDVLSLKYMVDAANANVSLQRSLAWPSPELGFIYNPQNTVPYFGTFATLHIPLFARNQGEIKKARIQLHQAEESLNYKRTQSDHESAKALALCRNSLAELKDYENLQRKGEAMLQHSRQAFAGKRSGPGDYLEAQKNWLELNQLYLQSLENHLLNCLHFLYVTGSLKPVLLEKK